MSRKTVRTLSPSDLTRAADELMTLVERSGFAADAVVGIETGGRKVVDALSVPPPIVLSCRMTRPSTEAKSSAPGRHVLRRLPYPLADRLRLLEDRLASRELPSVPAVSPELERGVGEIAKVVSERGLQRLLVVDDAVDSGRSLACVLGAMQGQLPQGVEIRSAVLTRTRAPEQTAVLPDFALHSMVLLRFPWSFDYKAAR